MIRKTERILRSGNNDPVEVLYDEANDQIKMARADADGNQKVVIEGQPVDVTLDEPIDVVITSPLESNGAIPVNIQDQHTPAFDVTFARALAAPTTLTTAAVVDAWSISVTTGHGLIATNHILLTDSASGRSMPCQVLSVAGDNTVNLDTPVNFAYPVATTALIEISHDLTVNGAGTRVPFYFGTSAAGISLDVTRIMFQITTGTAPLITDFGDIDGGLPRGLVLRKTTVANGTTNLWNLKSNAEMALLMYDVHVYEATKQFLASGIAGRLTYGGQNKHGVTLRLDPGDFLELIVQDNLTSLTTFNVLACGHIVTD